MHLDSIALTTIDGDTTTFKEFSDKLVMVVNVASRCGFTPQYAGLEKLYRTYSQRGFTVLGFPSNQFMFQEPGDADDIKEFCRTHYDITFPLFEKVNVNGRKQHPLFAELTSVQDSTGKAGKIQWNFEKFVIAPHGTVRRFRSATPPDAPEIISAIEESLPG